MAFLDEPEELLSPIGLVLLALTCSGLAIVAWGTAALTKKSLRLRYKRRYPVGALALGTALTAAAWLMGYVAMLAKESGD
jgi:hypothetical protein